jgi:hypothetical protein
MNKAILILLTTTLGTGLVSLHLVRELRGERATIQSLQARIGELERAAATPGMPASVPPAIDVAPEPAAGNRPLPAALPAPIPVARTVDAAPLTGHPPMPSREERMRMMRESVERQRALLKDPEYREAMRMQYKMMQSQNYPDLAKTLGISAEQADQMLTLLAEQQIRMQENGPAQSFMEQPPERAALNEMRRKAEQTRRANEAELAGLLGQEKMREWNDYQKTLGTRMQVKQLSTKFAGKGAPLTDEQERQLVQALAAEQQRGLREASPAARINFISARPAALAANVSMSGAADHLEMQERHLEQMAQQNQRMRDAAATVLTPEQLSLFEEEHNSQLQMQRAMLRMARAQADAEARGEVSEASQTNTGFIFEAAAPPATP